MKKLLLIGLLCILNIHVANAENSPSIQKKINYGQKIFRKKLQRKCGYTASYWAQQHTKKEWETYQDKSTFKTEFTQMCPRGAKVMKEKWITSLYLFATEYAKDTGNRPRC